MRPRNTALVLGLLVGLALAPDARAVEVTVLTPTTVTVAPGASFTIELAIDNASMEPVNGMVVDLTGLAGNAVATAGVSADSYFNAICDAAFGCLGGINTNTAAFFNNRDLANGGSYIAGDDLIRLASPLTLDNVTNTGAVDPGITYMPGIVDPVDVRLVLQRIAGAGSFDLTVTSSFNTNGVGETILAPLTITVNVPEPGTALMLGLGLAALAGRARRGRLGP